MSGIELATIMFCAAVSVVDGDTIKCDGQSLRPMGPGSPHVSGFDTPEIWTNQCPHELDLARAAKERLKELLANGQFVVLDSGERDRTKQRRPLVWIMLADGRTVGEVLLSEGHARPWLPDAKNDWCGGDQGNSDYASS
ncbi:MAG: thermonuclease family protein [Cognatishimia activa]